jgi:xanthine/uracil/vitamin C permease (AzgA family)
MLYSSCSALAAERPPLTAILGATDEEVLSLQNKLINRQESNMENAFPAFIIIIMIALCYSISTGLAFGFISFAILKTMAGKVKDVKPVMWIITVLSVLYFIISPISKGS